MPAAAGSTGSDDLPAKRDFNDGVPFSSLKGVTQDSLERPPLDELTGQPDEREAGWLNPPPHGFGRRPWPRRGINEAEPPALAG
jgi:hypothetical protein